MKKIGFFTPVTYQAAPNRLLEKVDAYFFLGGQKAVVLAGKKENGRERVVLSQHERRPMIESAAKVASYCTVVIPLLLLALKAILRSQHRFMLVDPKKMQEPKKEPEPVAEPKKEPEPVEDPKKPLEIARKELEQGIEIAPSTIAKIQSLLPLIEQGKDDGEIQWIAKGNSLVFSLASTPNLVFKLAKEMHDPNRPNARTMTDLRFENMIKAKDVCLTHQLDRLILPHAKKIEVGAAALIAEERLSFNPNWMAQERFYYERGKDLVPTLGQLAIFTAKTGSSDNCWRNLPILDGVGQSKIGLIDVEHMESAHTGFFGNSWLARQGLIACAGSEEQIDEILNQAAKHGVSFYKSEAHNAKDKRLKELAEDRNLDAFHAKLGVKEPQKPLQVDFDSLGLDLKEVGKIHTFVEKGGKRVGQKKSVTLKEVAEALVEKINKEFKKSPLDASIKRGRQLQLNVGSGKLGKFANLGLPKGQSIVSEEEAKKQWLDSILNALVAKGYLFKLDKRGCTYVIQA